MANLPSSFVYVNDVEVAQDAPVTEALNSKLGSNDNYLKDAIDQEVSDRTAADSSLSSDISSVASDLSTLTARVDVASNVDHIYSATFVVGGVNATTIGQYVITADASGLGRWGIARITSGAGPTFTYTFTTVLDSGVAADADLHIPVLRVESTSSNLFFHLDLYQIYPV